MPAGAQARAGSGDKGLGSQGGVESALLEEHLQNQNDHYILNTEQAEQSSPGACLRAPFATFKAVWSFLRTYSGPVLCGMLKQQARPLS